jgi:hypothetical protein
MAKKKKLEVNPLSFLENNNLKPKTIYFNEREIQVKQYLPIESKIELIQLIINTSFIKNEETNLSQLNPCFKELLYNYFLVKFYTDLSLNNEYSNQYDLLKSSGLLDQIISVIPIEELELLNDLLIRSIKQEFYRIEQERSFNGIVNKLMNIIKDFDIEKMIEQLGNLQNSELIQEWMKQSKNVD